MEHYYPVSTIADGQGLNITLQSYLDRLDLSWSATATWCRTSSTWPTCSRRVRGAATLLPPAGTGEDGAPPTV